MMLSCDAVAASIGLSSNSIRSALLWLYGFLAMHMVFGRVNLEVYTSSIIYELYRVVLLFDSINRRPCSSSSIILLCDLCSLIVCMIVL